MRRTALAVAVWSCLALAAVCAADSPMAIIHEQIAAHPGQTGTYVLEKGEEALLARAWLGDHAERSIDVQYFIWKADNIGILAAEALLRAAERGVRVRILVDDLLINAPKRSMLALARHPNIDIRVYNPKNSVGVSTPRRYFNLVCSFRGFNQRMHDKVFVADGAVAITGGRNMEASYYDFDHEFNYRDRDALLVGDAVKALEASFQAFWESGLTADVEGLLQKTVPVTDEDVRGTYRELHDYASSPANFAPEVRAAVDGAPRAFGRLSREMAWGEVDVVADVPGKNDARFGLSGGGRSAAALKELMESAHERIVIQSPYLILSSKAKEVFRHTLARGVRVRIHTNSLASTDNLAAFSGYRSQRRELLAMGLEIYEYKPDPEVQRQLMQSSFGVPVREKMPVFGLHAKTMVVDSGVVYIGTFNLDPRSENLNTEVGVVIRNETVAKNVEAAIETDMGAGNSWNAGTDNPDRYVSRGKLNKVRFWQLLPLKSLL